MIAVADSFVAHAERYLLANPCCRKHQENIRGRIARFVAWFPGSPKSLAPEDLNGFLASLERDGLSAHTINGYRATIMAVWRFVLGERIRWKIRRVRPPQREVKAWSVGQVKQLLSVAVTLRGRLPNGVQRRLFFLTAIHAGFSTGQRYGDLARLPVAAIRADRTATFVQSKTGRRVTVRFSEKAVRCIRAHGQATVLPNPHTQQWFCVSFADLVERAGIKRGSFRWLRRSAGSYVERATGRGPELLGNTRAVFEASYQAESITRKPPPEPPRL